MNRPPSMIDSSLLKTSAAPFGSAAAIVLVALLALLYAAWDGVAYAVSMWRMLEYSYYIPPLIVFFIWQRKHQLAAEPFVGAWAGAATVLFAAQQVSAQLGPLVPD